jgi:hypothetical protein
MMAAYFDHYNIRFILYLILFLLALLGSLSEYLFGYLDYLFSEIIEHNRFSNTLFFIILTQQPLVSNLIQKFTTWLLKSQEVFCDRKRGTISTPSPVPSVYK